MKNLSRKLCFAALLFINLVSFAQVPKLNSLQDAATTAVIFLDFDGQYVNSVWNNYTPFNVAAPNLSATEITEIFNRVSEDFRPFTINVTTDSTKFWAMPANKRTQIIVTPTYSWYPYSVGGVSYVGSMGWGTDIPGFVFNTTLGTTNVIQHISEACSHEAGHTLGLSHQAKFDQACGILESYNSGYGVNMTEISWAPLMGKSYNKNMTGWNDGPVPSGCSVLQDNLSTILTNGITYRIDDYAETLDANTTTLNSTSFSVNGIITTPSDRDAFKVVYTQSKNVHIVATPFNVGANNLGANLDMLVQLYDGNANLIRTYDPQNSMSVTIDTLLTAGTYYFVVDGTGNANGSNYSSLGSYSLTGIGGFLAIHEVALKGSSDGKQHKLNWNIISDEPIVKQEIQYASDGINFVAMFADNGQAKNLNTTPKINGNTYYRLKVTSSIGETTYSNIVSLKANTDKLFSINNPVKDNIQITALQNYNYILYDANAKLMTTGEYKKGINTINISNYSNGLYILKMVSNNYTQTERIIKQ